MRFHLFAGHFGKCCDQGPQGRDGGVQPLGHAARAGVHEGEGGQWLQGLRRPLCADLQGVGWKRESSETT